MQAPRIPTVGMADVCPKDRAFATGRPKLLRQGRPPGAWPAILGAMELVGRGGSFECASMAIEGAE